MNNADIAWMLVSTALVLLMTPALAFFYGGLVRSKNALNTMMMSFVALGPVAVVWALLGYSLAFAPGNAFIGSLGFAGLRGVGMEAQGTIPHLLFMAFQGTFAIITPGADFRGGGRAHAVQRLPRVHRAVGARGVCAGRALGLGRRVPGDDGRARFRRRRGRACECGIGGAGRGGGGRSAQGLRASRHPPAQRALHDARRRPVVVRLVRLQRRQRAIGRHDGHPRLHEHAARARGRHSRPGR